MKKILLSALIFTSILCSSQINMSPVTHYNDPYLVTVSGSGTIYYTTDGSTPTLSSSSAANSVQILIDSNKEIKAFVVNSGTTSSVFSKKYYTGAIPTATMYFKMPSNWATGSCAMIEMVNPNAVNGFAIDSLWPGFPMTNTGCENWYKVTRNFENGTVSFNNCSPFPSIPQTITTNTVPVNGVIYYDFTNGPISNPPSCLFLGTNETKNNPITLVKIYPNPVSDILKISSDIDFKEYEIVDISGKTISKDRLSSKEIPISHLSTGNYFIKLKDENRNTILLKFIKK
ncbi:T9SS type A sorting domain-containing protein [Chryseobacterium ginsenosidimutans]|uniref:T9SS type A sorting domain-containing protein n=1 Tax=Chryseobacterium ginsenosidimutans TaxID=687846 RepID=UPI0031D00E33